MDMGFGKRRLTLEYPCEWGYKIIGTGEDALRDAIRDVVLERTHTVSRSHTSRGGKYVCLNLDLIVLNEGDRKDIYEGLRSHPSVRLVL